MNRLGAPSSSKDVNTHLPGPPNRRSLLGGIRQIGFDAGQIVGSHGSDAANGFLATPKNKLPELPDTGTTDPYTSVVQSPRAPKAVEDDDLATAKGSDR